MMDAKTLVTILEAAIASCGLVIVVFWLWPCMRLDIFRQKMFALRDELFDYAESGRIGFNHPAYRLLRQSMNGFIRYGHRLTFFQINLMMLYWKFGASQPPMDWTEKWNRAIATVNDEQVRENLVKFHERSIMLVSERLVLGSPVLLLVLFVGLLIGLFNLGWKSAKAAFNRAIAETTSRLIDFERLEEEAARAA
ncbi:MAG TPA: hypothetical protein VN924_21430 [Bryobacteraceae bacterium]|jgi:hypothetical protein|nr:hypothetical protein [Bryobacteraceae bacterium]